MYTILTRAADGFWFLSSFSNSESEIRESIRDLVYHGISVLDILVLDHTGISKYMIPKDLPTDRYTPPERKKRFVEPKITTKEKEWIENIPE